MFHQRLRKARLENSKLNQKEFSQKFELSDARYNQYEQGKRMPDYDLVVKFANFLNVSTDYLLKGENHVETTNKKEEETKDKIAEKIKEEFLKIIDETPNLKEMLDDEFASKTILKNIESFGRSGIKLTMEMLAEFATNKSANEKNEENL